MNRLMLLLTGSCGLFAGVLLGGSVKDWGKVAAMGGLAATPICYIAHTVIDSKASRKVREAQKKATQATTALEQAKSQVTAKENEIHGLMKSLRDMQDKLSASNKETLQLKETLATFQPVLTQLEQLQTTLTQSKAHIEELEAECEAWENEFDTRVAKAANERFQEARKGELEKIFQESDSVTQQAMELFKRLQNWGEKVAHGHQAKREIIVNLANQYNANLDELNTSVERERAEYLNQIDLLREKVAILQHELAGDLVEPQYGKFGYQWDARIADDIARKVWDSLHVPMSVKGYKINPDGSAECGYGYSRSQSVEALVQDLSRMSGDIAKSLGIHKITSVRKHDLSDLLIVSWRRESAVKEDTVKLLAGTAEEFISYVTSHPIRYRLIADPGCGKTPTTAVMVSEILKVGGTRGNTGKGRKIPNMLVAVSCPDVESSQKDADYPLEIFLKYGNTTTAVKSIDDALEDWQYRKRDTTYAENFFQLWVWDELDNTLSSCSDPKGTGEAFKKILKQCHHTGVGWIVSGQSVMTSQIPGFMDDDRELFTQIIIGTSKIRKYLEKYGKKILSAKVVSQLLKNLDDLEPYIEDKNSIVTDSARLLRLALILDDKSPKLYFLPNLDRAKFDAGKAESVITQANQMKHQFLVRVSGKTGSGLVSEVQNAYVSSAGEMVANPPFSPIGGADHSSQSSQIPHCPHCGGSDLKVIENGKRYRCQGCTKRFVNNKAVWK